MMLHFFKTQSGPGNFGDELNPFIWDKFLPGLFDNNIETVFFGIGTILRASKNYPRSKIIVFGSGAPNAEIKKDYDFNFYFVRGPLTAKYFNLSNDQAITDPAILTPLVFPVAAVKKEFKFGYMPHWSVENNQYRSIIESMGMLYISPLGNVEEIINQINKCSVMICEAMHAAIVADAYRIPWIPVSTFKSFNRFKWDDWSKSLLINLNIMELPRLYDQSFGINKLIRKILFKRKIKALLKHDPTLSAYEIFNKRQEQILQQVSKIKADYNLG